MTEQGRSGNIGEEIAATELGERGWAVSRPMANQPNYDLIAEKDGQRKLVQVKTSGEPKTLNWIAAGKCNEEVLHKSQPMLNTVPGHPHCEIVMCVTYLRNDPEQFRIWIFPIDQAEHYFSKHAKAYYGAPKRDGSPRKPGPVFIQVGGKRPYPGMPDDREHLEKFKNAWHYLDD